MNLRRDLVKYVRDKAKSKYRKSTECYICGSKKNLDFHHFYSLTELLERWIRKHNLKIKSAEEIMRLRDAFIEDHKKELFDDTITLCHTHHLKLHSIYGKKPQIITAKKQPRWAQKQRDKYGLVR
jgi:queuine/archaeosine tRNA-ribosyltransferase|tara:strand:- start:1029 stop:1403 length:375 start_codon:yes stop_codon:yes gene_type:complete